MHFEKKRTPNWKIDEDFYSYRLSAYERLLLHVLYRAIRDLFEKSPEISKPARAWLERRSPDRYPWFSCTYCLEILNIKPALINEILDIAKTPGSKFSIDYLARAGFGSF